MNSDRIVNRINDLLKLTGVKDSHTIEELTDHYLTHIEEEVKRGVNSQKAIRETYQEIANLDTSQFLVQQRRQDKKGLFVFILLFVGIAFYFLHQNQEVGNDTVDTAPTQEISVTNPLTGVPIQQSNLKVSSEFGMRLNPLSKEKALHKGIDIRAKIGTPVLSTGNGFVKEAGYKPQAGIYVSIQHEGNFTTNYFHLSSLSVTSNEEVKAGQMIGKVGNTGMSMNPHLHYEVLKDEVPVNPREYIEP